MADLQIRQSNMADNGDVRIVTILGRMTISSAQELKAELLEALALANHVRVDVDNVTEIDITAMQLLCAAHRTAIGSQKCFGIESDKSGILADFAEKSGFSHHLGCMDGVECLWNGGGE